MRRLVVSVLCASGLVLTGAGTALAEEAPGAAAKAPAGKRVCKISDERLDELSGLVATDDGFIVVNDSTDQSSKKRVFFLDTKCKVKDDQGFGGNGPRDPEDLSLTSDGKNLWIADIGDNDKERDDVVIWSMPADGSKKAELFRLKYPDGAHNAEALLVNGNSAPIIVTWEAGRAASVYTTPEKLKKGGTVALQKAGEIKVPASETPAVGIGVIGRGTITGGAVSRDGSKVVLRTYTDALEFAVTNGDVVAALQGKPRVTPLPNETQGEGISYSADGKLFYTVSDMQGNPSNADNFILRYTPLTSEAPVVKSNAGGDADKKTGPSWFQSLDLNDITYMVGGVGVLGLILVGLGIFGIRRHRKNAPLEAPVIVKKKSGSGDDDGPAPADAATELLTVGGAKSGPGVYGSGGGAPRGGPGVYGAGAAAGASAGAGTGRPAGAGRPPVVNGRPSGGGRPPQGGGRPPQGGGRPPQGGGRPPQGGGRPPEGGGRPPQGGPPARAPQGGGRPSQGAGGRPPQGGGRPPQGGGRPPQGQPRPAQGGPRPAQGGQPRPAQGGQPRPPQGGQPRPPQGGQPRPPQGAGRPPQGGGRPPQGGQPRPPQGGGRPGGGVYGAPPPGGRSQDADDDQNRGRTYGR